MLTIGSGSLFINLQHTHQAQIFILKVVALIDCAAGKILEGHPDPCFLSCFDQDGVLPGALGWQLA